MINVRNVRDKEDLAVQVPNHLKWLNSEEGGEKLSCSVGADLSGVNLSGADLSEADLIGADLSGADLSEADLSDADLRDANLRRANLSDAYLSGADLRDADFSGADLSDADLRDADLSGTDLSGVNLSGADLSDANLSDATIPVQTICYWEINVNATEITIGCKTKSAEEWDSFFENKEFYAAAPNADPVEYELIRLGFEQAKIAQKMLLLRSRNKNA